MVTRITVSVFLSFIAIACSGASSNAGTESGGRAEGGPVASITAAPMTYEVELPQEVRQRLELHLARGTLDVARLVLRDVQPRSAQALKGVLIFIEKPDANARTPVDDPHYVGNFVLGLEPSQSMLWNVAPTLSKLWQSGELTAKGLAAKKGLRITFVPQPWDWAKALPKDFALPFQSLTIEVPERP